MPPGASQRNPSPQAFTSSSTPESCTPAVKEMRIKPTGNKGAPPLAAKDRLDRILVDRGLVSSRQEAQGLIMAGQVFVDGRKTDKAGTMLPRDADVRIAGVRQKYASRGGLKLEAALDAFGIEVRGRSAIDVGASTGGFTDCLLARGAVRVLCVDVGYGQLADRLRRDARVVVKDRFNARYISRGDIPWPCDLVVIDVSFISLKLIVPPLVACLEPCAEIVALVKPQFEVGRGKVGKGGIVRDASLRESAVESIELMMKENTVDVLGRMESPITGADGNVEYLLWAATPRNS